MSLLAAAELESDSDDGRPGNDKEEDAEYSEARSTPAARALTTASRLPARTKRTRRAMRRMTCLPLRRNWKVP
jgi:hypothetical protein